MRPWEHSTGPRTKLGKRKVSRNARKEASWSLWLALSNMGANDQARVIYRRLLRRERAKRARGRKS